MYIHKHREPVLLSLSSWCLLIVVCLFFVWPWVCLQFVIVVFPDYSHLLFFATSSTCSISVPPTFIHLEEASQKVLAVEAGQHALVSLQ